MAWLTETSRLTVARLQATAEDSATIARAETTKILGPSRMAVGLRAGSPRLGRAGVEQDADHLPDHAQREGLLQDGVGGPAEEVGVLGRVAGHEDHPGQLGGEA